MSSRILCLAGLAVLLAASATAQPTPSADRVVRVNGAAPGAAGQQTTLHFAIYDASSGGEVVWQETQTVVVDPAGQYTAYLGALSADGLPLEVFASGAPRWLSVDGQSGPLGARTLLAAVPYAVSAANATTLAGRPATDFQLTPAASRRDTAAAAGGAAPATAQAPLVVNGSVNFLSKFTNAIDLGSSQVYDNGANVGVGTTSPLDKLHVQFTNTVGSLTGYAVQNLGSTATSYSGMLFYDHTGALRQFQGYNNATGEYRINNLSPTPSINFMTGSTSRFLVDASGNVGIGQTSPQYRLDVQHNTLVGLRVKSTSGVSTIDIDAAGGGAGVRLLNNGAGQWLLRSETSTNDLTFTRVNQLGPAALLVQNSTGNVGIGTTTPDVRLDVSGSSLVSNSATSAYFTPGSSALVSGYTGSFFGVSIRASNYIIGGGIGAISDARIKLVRGRSNAAADLDTLNAVQIVDYTFKDTVAQGRAVQKKVVAQQVEQVFPQAVSQTTGVVPDIFATAPQHEGWISLATDLKVGERVRLVTRAGQQMVYDVMAVEPGRFRTALDDPASPEVFVYGREVQDFRVVDYEAISMLNVSATQELARRLERQTAANDMLKAQNLALESRLAAVEAALKALGSAAPQWR
ncbi:MAG: tail fiber domain-containing protein [Vicinamibacterales bacterium]